MEERIHFETRGIEPGLLVLSRLPLPTDHSPELLPLECIFGTTYGGLRRYLKRAVRGSLSAPFRFVFSSLSQTQPHFLLGPLHCRHHPLAVPPYLATPAGIPSHAFFAFLGPRGDTLFSCYSPPAARPGGLVVRRGRSGVAAQRSPLAVPLGPCGAPERGIVLALHGQCRLRERDARPRRQHWFLAHLGHRQGLRLHH